MRMKLAAETETNRNKEEGRRERGEDFNQNLVELGPRLHIHPAQSESETLEEVSSEEPGRSSQCVPVCVCTHKCVTSV